MLPWHLAPCRDDPRYGDRRLATLQAGGADGLLPRSRLSGGLERQMRAA